MIDVARRGTDLARTRRDQEAMSTTEWTRLLDEVLEKRSRFAWYETLGDLSLLSHVPRSLAGQWANLTALDRARSLCASLDGCPVLLRNVPGTQYYAALSDPPPPTYGELACILRDTIDSLTAAREARRPPSVRPKRRKRRVALS
jgi:hypothetical protein